VYCTGNTLDDDRDVYGREQLHAELQGGRDRRVLLVGLRRTGKTATLLWLERQALADPDAPVPVRIAPEGVESPDRLRNGFANALSRRRKLLPALPGGYLALRKLDLDELLVIAEEAAEDAGRGLLLLLDEVDAIARLVQDHPWVASTLREGFPRGERSRVIATGSRRALRLLRAPGGAGEPLLAGFSLRTLPPRLGASAASSLARLDQRGGTGAVPWSEAQIAELLTRTGGHPYLTQAACKVGLDLRCDPAHAVATVLDSHEATAAFAQDMERIAPAEREVLDQVLAGNTPRPELDPFRRGLAELGVLDRDGVLTVPVLGDFLRTRGWGSFPVRLSDDEVAPGSGAAAAPSKPAPSTGMAPVGSPSYRTVRTLGSGSFGDVVLVEATSARGVRRLVAIKLLKTELEANEVVVRRLRDEARMLARLRHRAIVRAEDLVRVDGRLGVVMEYVPGVDLADVLPESRRQPVPPRAVCEILGEIGDALHVAYHRVPEGEARPFRVLHRDIKPHNLRLTGDGELKVLDFGVSGAHFEGREHRTLGAAGGTPMYMAPERHRGRHDHPGSDVFALGLVGTGLAFGAWHTHIWAPYEAAHQVEVEIVRRDIQASGGVAFAQLLAEMLAYDPDTRPEAGDVASRALALAGELPGAGLRTWARSIVTQREVQERSTIDLDDAPEL